MYGAVVVFYETVSDHPCMKEMSQALDVHEEVRKRWNLVRGCLELSQRLSGT